MGTYIFSTEQFRLPKISWILFYCTSCIFLYLDGYNLSSIFNVESALVPQKERVDTEAKPCISYSDF